LHTNTYAIRRGKGAFCLVPSAYLCLDADQCDSARQNQNVRLSMQRQLAARAGAFVVTKFPRPGAALETRSLRFGSRLL